MKPPKRRFQIGDRFEDDGATWTLIHMYLLQREQGIWFHVLEEEKLESESLGMLETLVELKGIGFSGTNMVYEPFRSHTDARDYFRNRVMRGSQSTKTTQQLIALKKL